MKGRNLLCLCLVLAMIPMNSWSVILTKEHRKALKQMKPKDRKLFIELSRNVELERYMERERFREMLNRMMNSMVRRHNTENEMGRIESEAYIDLQRRFGRAESKVDRMRDHTVGMVNDLIALT
jgi:hypothetical protein